MPKNNTMSSYKEDESLQTEADLVLGTKDVVAEIKFTNKNGEVVVERQTVQPYNSSVKLQSLRDAHVQYTGQVTGKSYEWIRAGSIQVVDILDAPYLLSKRIKTQSCCSGSDIAVFQQID